MRINKICIRNLKSIKYLLLDLEQQKKSVTLLYGNNGVGKTTILEALSLVGHVSCMRKVAVPDNTEQLDDKPSEFFVNHSTKLKLVSESNTFDTLKANIKKHRDIDAWANSFNEKKAALVSFEMVTGESGMHGLKSKPLSFHIYFKQEPYSITQALSQKSSDDAEMNNLFALVYSHSIRNEVDAFVTHFYKHSSHCIRLDGEERIFAKDVPSASGSNIVSYINTDLNDFGRKNDVRESVKDIYRDFGAEIVGRLSLPFDDNGSFTKLDELNEILKEVIRDYTSVTPAIYNEEALFRIMELTCIPNTDGAEKKYSTTIRAERYGDKDKPLDYMSAGENECFFIFMLLLGLPMSESIILLDEPDLHLTTLAKEAFYKQLFQIFNENKCQVIISTHSLFAYSAEKTVVDRKLIKRVIVSVEKNGETENKIVHKAIFDSGYFLKLHKHYWRTARKAWKVIEIGEVLRLVWQHWLDRLEIRFGLDPGVSSLMGNFLIFLISTIVLWGSAAAFNDMLLWVGEGNENHVWMAKLFQKIIGGLFLVACLIWTIRYYFKGKDK